MGGKMNVAILLAVILQLLIALSTYAQVGVSPRSAPSRGVGAAPEATPSRHDETYHDVIAKPGESEVVVENRIPATLNIIINGRTVGRVNAQSTARFTVPDGNNTIRADSRTGTPSRDVKFYTKSQRTYFRATGPNNTTVSLTPRDIHDIIIPNAAEPAVSVAAPVQSAPAAAQERYDDEEEIISDDGLTSAAKALELHHVVAFNDVEINMHVFYSDLSDGGYSLDSLVFRYGGVMQTVHLHSLDEPLHIFDFDPDNFHHITVSDFNFDGYMDIQIYDVLRSGASNMRYKLFLFNPQSNKYYYHHELSEMVEVWADAETQTVKTRGKGGEGGMAYNFREFAWVSGELTLVRSENQEYDSASERFVRTTRTLQKNGDWVEEKKTVEINE